MYLPCISQVQHVLDQVSTEGKVLGADGRVITVTTEAEQPGGSGEEEGAASAHEETAKEAEAPPTETCREEE